ncbi:hypothetical protein [Marinicella rhabdoformis]|uniref:hypothetical protein n=1 Tax=Marinicella rhabdoformis TaxID=2580566 RepID=UPI0012AECC12|nr:hypothetical protein [Marinicella rhabdoformis]
MSDKTISSAAFSSAEEIFNSSKLSKSDKISLLQEWECTVRQMQVAEEENMTSGPDANLKEVLDYLHKLGAESVHNEP